MLRLMGDNFDPDLLTKELSIIPSESWRKGELSKNLHTTKTYDCWIYETGYKITDDVNDLLNIIHSVFDDKKHQIKVIANKFDLDISLDIIIKMENGDTPALYFGKNIIDFVHYLDAEIDVDMYINEA